jgi:hypothetical protein
MTKLYNPSEKIRAEIPEYDKRLQLRNHTLLGQRVAINHENTRIVDYLQTLIENYPLSVYWHVFEYRNRGLLRLKLCKRGYAFLFKQMDSKHFDVIEKLRIRKRQNKAILNLKKNGII